MGDVFINQEQREKMKEVKEEDDEEDFDELLIFDELELESSDIVNMETCDKVLHYIYDKKQCQLNVDIISTIQSLWNQDVVKEIYNKRNITKIEASTAYFWDKLDVIKDANYLPDEQDIMLCRLITTGLHEMTFKIKNDTFNIIDVGGQRSQRRKWIHCFEYVVAVIFICSLSCYDEILHEDSTVNAMVDQLELFEDICNNRSLSKTAMILFLNKKDLFKQKYVENKVPLTICPPPSRSPTSFPTAKS